MHPNTVQYRVNKAKELFGLNFTCEYRNLLYHLSCIMLLYSGRERQPGTLP